MWEMYGLGVVLLMAFCAQTASAQCEPSPEGLVA